MTGNTIIPTGSAGDALIGKFLTGDIKNNTQSMPLKIPRRPAWTKEMTAQEINQ